MPYADPLERKRYMQEYYRSRRETEIERAREYRRLHPERVKAALERVYARRKDDPTYKEKRRLYHLARRAKNWRHVRAIEQRSYERHKTARLAYQAKHSRSAGTLARAFLNRAIRDKTFPRAATHACGECHRTAREYHHHLGYARKNWLCVTPLCSRCHRKAHQMPLVPGRASSY